MFRKGKRNVTSGPVSSIFFVFFFLFPSSSGYYFQPWTRSLLRMKSNHYRKDVIDIIIVSWHLAAGFVQISQTAVPRIDDNIFSSGSRQVQIAVKRRESHRDIIDDIIIV